MTLQEFAQLHLPALEGDEIRFNVQIPIIAAALKDPESRLSYWMLGPPGHCAIQSPGRAILLGNVEQAECEALAEITQGLDVPGVVGADNTARWFAEHAAKLGAKFEDPIPQRIHVLSGPPLYPVSQGSARPVTAADAPLLFEWIMAFRNEAVPHDPAPERANIEKAAGSDRYMFWTNNGKPVSFAAISRRLRNTAAIAPVYTPPEHRSKGYAGSVTAALCDRIFAEGKTSVCLYTDLRNPMSNRCYAKIGFKPYCDSLHYPRAAS